MPSDSAPPSGCPDWAAIACDYAANAVSVSAICALHGISSRTLYRRARGEGWTLRRPVPGKAAGRARAGDACPGDAVAVGGADGPAQADSSQTPRSAPPAAALAPTAPARRKPSASAPRSVRGKQPIAKRLLTALEEKMSDFESRLATAPAASAADSARDARTLSTLVTLFEKMEKHGAKAASRGEASPSGAQIVGEGLDAGRIREQLALRLEALRSGLAGEACAAWDDAVANPVPPGAWASETLGLRGDPSRLG